MCVKSPRSCRIKLISAATKPIFPVKESLHSLIAARIAVPEGESSIDGTEGACGMAATIAFTSRLAETAAVRDEQGASLPDVTNRVWSSDINPLLVRNEG